MTRRACPVCGRDTAEMRDGKLYFHYAVGLGSLTCGGSLTKVTVEQITSPATGTGQ